MRWFIILPLISLFPLLTVTERTTWLPPASVTVRCAQCFQRGISLQVPKENLCKGKVWLDTEFQLSCLIILSGSRISSSCNHSNLKNWRFPKFCAVWGRPVEGEETLYHGTLPLATVSRESESHRMICQAFAAFPEAVQEQLFLGAVGAQGSHLVRCYLPPLLSATDSVCSSICFCPTATTMIPSLGRWSFQGKIIFSLTASHILKVFPPDYHLVGPSSWGLSPRTVGLLLLSNHLPNSNLLLVHYSCWLIFLCCW